MKTEGFFSPRKNIFSLQKGTFLSKQGNEKCKNLHRHEKVHFFKGVFFLFATIIKEYSFSLRYKIRIFAISWGLTSVPPSWQWSNTVELFIWAMSCLQYISCQALNQIQVVQSNLWTCEVVLGPGRTAVKIQHSAFAQVGVPQGNEAQSNEHSQLLVVFRCQ